MKKVTILTAILLATITYAQVPAYVPTNGLVGWWPFNGNANDETGNGNNGTVNGATLTTDRNGLANKAYSFNGASNYIDCGPLSAIPNTVGDITQSAWILATNNQTAYCKMPIMSKRQLDNQGWPTIGAGSNGAHGFPVNNQAYFFLNAQNYSAGVINAMSSTDLTNDGNWHLVTGTKNGSTYKLYFDGTLQATLTDNYSLTSNSNLIIGHEAMWGFECEKWFAGKIDDIGIWNRALTESEILTLYLGCNLSITSQPQDQSVNSSVGSTSFSVATSSPTTTYQWQTNLGLGFQNLSNAGQYSGATSSTLSVSNLSMTNNNQVFRCLINDGGCIDTSTIATLTIIDDASISETGFPLISISPNPTTGDFNIAGLELYNTISTMRVSDVNGKLVKELDPTANKFTFGSVKSGVYFLTITAVDKQEVIKIIKE
jgi:hypothetical protein